MSTSSHTQPSQISDEHTEDESHEDFAVLLSELGESVETYCRRRPGVVAGLLFGLGFFCGWKLRPW